MGRFIWYPLMPVKRGRKKQDSCRITNEAADRTLIRMNVDNFEEAFEYLKSKGFTNPGGRVIETESSKSAMLVAPSEFSFDLCRHKNGGNR